MGLKPIDQQVVVLVGASSGIGREAALRFARRGAKVVVSARGEEGLDTLVDEIKRDGGEAIAVTADVAHFDQVQAIAERAVEHFGRIDTWVHLAGIGLFATFEQTTPEEFKRVIEVNLLGQVHGAMVALPRLRQTGRGALIHISSVESVIAFPYHSAYAASKHGMTGFIDALRVELEHEGVPISVTNVLPAAINTPFFGTARTKLGVKPAAPPPAYQPGIVADTILYAAEYPTRDIIAGGAGKAMVMTQKFAPRLMDRFVRGFGFTAQRSNVPKSIEAPDSMYAPVRDFETAEGEFGHIAFSRSIYTWLQTHPWVKRAAVSTAIGATALLVGRRAG
jgi:NAD(P)-dependent dehydrogenase (short-subunit alcohol dehydrogenase family)